MNVRTALALVLATVAASAALASPANAVGTFCVTGHDDVYTGCTSVIVVPGTYCYVGSAGTIAGTSYEVGPFRC